MTKYAINQTQTTVGITGLKLEIPIGDFVMLNDEDSAHVEVLECIRRGWIIVSDLKPGEVEAFKPNIQIEVPPTEGSKTIPTTKKKKATAE